MGDAGEVEYSDGTVTLVDYNANSGWTANVDKQENDKIQVSFTQGDTEWKLVAEAKGDVLEIERKQEVQPAEDGTWQIGDFGEVSFEQDGPRSLELTDVQANEDWDVVIDEDDVDEVSARFVKGNTEWKFEAELEDGEIELDVKEEITGPVESRRAEEVQDDSLRVSNQ